MTERQKIELLQELVMSIVHATLVANGLRRGKESIAYQREQNNIQRVARLLLDRPLTDSELNEVIR